MQERRQTLIKQLLTVFPGLLRLQAAPGLKIPYGAFVIDASNLKRRGGVLSRMAFALIFWFPDPVGRLIVSSRCRTWRSNESRDVVPAASALQRL